MQTFHITSEASKSFMRTEHVKVDTTIDDAGVASATATVDRGVTNPAYILSQGVLGSPDLFSRSRTSTVSSTDSAALGDAIKALHELGERHDVTGISLPESIRFADSSLFVSGRPTVDRIGRPAIDAISAAAQRVLELSGT